MNDPESRHQACWYGRRTPHVPDDIGCQTIVDGELLFCGHPMWYPVVGHNFDTRNCADCEYFRPRHRSVAAAGNG